MADLKVLFPSPCSEPWDGMAPHGCNRHCASCDKTIHDLSALTIGEAQQLLETADEVCVRAELNSDGVIKFKPSRTSTQRRMIGVVGASLSLASAACQTVPPSERPNRFEISGEVPYDYVRGPKKPVIRSSDGQTWPVRMEWRSNSFSAPNLYPGQYSVTYWVGCGGEELVVENIIIEDASVNLGALDNEDHYCIIVGVMVPADRVERG